MTRWLNRKFTPSHRKTKVTTDFHIAFAKKGLEPTKKDHLLSKTKKKPQGNGRRGTFAVQSNPIPTQWVTHKLENHYFAKVFP